MKQRIHSIDIVRGIIMIIMTLDHVRDFLHIPGSSPLNMETTTGVLFFTRWITHFCAPTFVFLGGVSIFLAGRRRTKKELSLFLLKRGIWLILSDAIIISLLFTLDPGYHIVVLEVLWATGFGMIIMALLIYLPLPVIIGAGLLILFGHNMLDPLKVSQHTIPGRLLTIFLTARGAMIPIGGGRLIGELYSVLPWSAAMFLGYGFGTLYAKGIDTIKRRKVLLISGTIMCVLFILLRLLNSYGDPLPWSVQRNAAHTILSFLNTTKQVPSLLYMLMTLGPVLILLSLTENCKNRVTAICEVFGSTPYFYFILHLTFVRILNILLIMVQGIPIKIEGYPLVWNAPGFGYPLWAVYLFWIMVVVILYFPCRWYGRYKRSHDHWWLGYV